MNHKPINPLESWRLKQLLTTTAELVHFGHGALAHDEALTARLLEAFEAPAFARLWSVVSPHTVVDVFRVKHLYDLVAAQLDQPGDLIECGVAGGGTGLMFALLLAEHDSDKHLYLLDSFVGLPEPDRRFDKQYQRADYAVERARVQQLLAHHGVAERCTLVPGWFEETLPPTVAERSFCFAHVDCDLHHSARCCIEHVYPQLGAGCPMVFDDYHDGSDGVLLAVNQHLATTGELLYLGPTSQVTLHKGVMPDAAPAAERVALQLDDDGRPSVDGVRVDLALDRVSADHAYQGFLQVLRGHHEERLEHLARFQRLVAAGTTG